MNTMVFAASLAAATAVAVSPTVVQAEASTEKDDELIMLGEKFDAAVKDVIAARERYDALYEHVLIATEANATWPDNQDDWSAEDAKHYFAALTAAQRDVGGQPLADADTALNEAYGRTDAMSKVIGNLAAHTVKGLSVKARAAKLACSHYWDAPIKKLDWDEEHSQRLIEATFQAGGVESVEGYLGTIATLMWGILRTPLDTAIERRRIA
jgi:hypothetical protein